MNLSDGIKSALCAAGKTQADLTTVFNVSPQAIANKQSRNSWSADELIRIAGSVGAKLTFEFPEGSKIVLELPE